MNKGKPVAGGNFSNVNYFQPGRQNQNNGNRNMNMNNNNSKFLNNDNNNNNNNRSNNNNNNSNNQGGNSNFHNNRNGKYMSANGNVKLKSRVKNDQRSKFSRNQNNNNNNYNNNINNTNNSSPNNNNTNNNNNNINNNYKNNYKNHNANKNNFNGSNSNYNAGLRKQTLVNNNMKKLTSIQHNNITDNHIGNTNNNLIQNDNNISVANNNQTDSSNFEVKFFGTLIQNAENLGFQKLRHRAQKTPKYILKANVLFDMTTYKQNQWDYENQQMLLKREMEYSGEPQLLFEEFQEYRKTEREMMEKFNLVDKENAKKSLHDAIIFRGSCRDMCPTFERVERVFKNQVSKWEKDPQTNKISKDRALKTFMRPSGQAPPLPSDVRSPDVLQKTLNYIIQHLLPKLPESQSFIWDRTRSIRQDFTFQNNYSGIESIDCHEKICRIHILSLHIMAGSDDQDYQQQQEVEQFNNSLQTLTHMYNDIRSRSGFCPNEPEFRSYELISKIKDNELDRYLQTLPDYIQNDPLVQRTIMLRSLIIEGLNSFNSYTEFFKAILDKSKTPFLLASLAEIHFNKIRYNALRAMTRLYHTKSKKMPEASYIASILGYNNIDQFLETCKLYQLQTFYDIEEPDIMRVEVTSLKTSFKLTQKQAYTERITEMMNGMSLPDIINSGKINSNLNLKESQSTEQIARESFKGSKQNSQNVNEIFAHNKEVVFSKPMMVSGPSPVIDNSPTISNMQQGITSNNLSTNTATNNIPAFNTSGFSFGQAKTFDFTNATPKIDLIPKNNTIDQAIIGNKTNSLTSTNSQNTNNVTPTTSQTLPPKPDLMNNSQVKNILPGKSTESSEVIQPVESMKPVKKLIGNQLFKVGAKKIVDDMVNKYIKNLSDKVVREKIEDEKRERALDKKKKIVNELSIELFNAFINEQIYLCSLEARAICFYNRSLKSKMMKIIIDKAKDLSLKKQENEEITNEIKAFNDNISVPITYPHLPITNELSLLKSRPPILKSKDTKSTLLRIFNQANPSFDVNGTIVLRFSNCYSSKWLLNQMGFNNDDKSIHLESESGYKLHISILPEKFEAKEYFNEISTIIIQVGTIEGVDDGKKSTLIKCLQRDFKVIEKLKNYVEKYSSSTTFSFLIVYVDSYNVGLSDLEIQKILKFDILKSYKIRIGFFELKNSLLNDNYSLMSIKKHQINFNRMLEKVWRKSFADNISNISNITSNSVIKNNNLTTRTTTLLNTTNANDTGRDPLPSSLIKRRLNYLHNVIDNSKLKKRRLSNRSRHSNVSSYLMNTSIISALNDGDNSQLSYVTNNNDIEVTNNSKIINHSSMFKNLNDTSKVKGFNNSLMMLRNYNVTVDSNNSKFDNNDDDGGEKHLQEINELDELADSILNN